jgi:hypothetical protein
MHQMMKQQPSPLVSQSRPYNQIPVYRVDSDARELTATELDKFKHLISRDNQRQLLYNPSNRNDGILLRVRGSLRNRNNAVNQVNVPTRDYLTNHQPLPTGSNSSSSSSSSSNSSSGSSSSNNSSSSNSVNNNNNNNSNNSNSNNQSNLLSERIFTAQTHNSLNSNLQITSRLASNSVNNLRLGNEAYLLDMARNSARLSRNTYNDIGIASEYNRAMNLGNIFNRNWSWLGSNFNQWINTSKYP